MDYRANETNTGSFLKEVLKDIQKGNVSSCYLLYGEEDFLIKEALDKIINLILPDTNRDLNLFSMDGEYADIEGLCQSLLMPPLIAGNKVVVLKNTRIFHSASISPELIDKIRDLMKSDPARAARDFMHFLRLTGWTLEDLKNDGWRRIRDDDWKKAVGEDVGQNRETWLPGIIEICTSHGIKEGSVIEGTDRLLDILRSGIPEGNHLILTAGTVDKRKKIFKIISERGKVLHFPSIKIESRKKQVLMDAAREILASAGKTITPGAWLEIGKKTGFVAASSVEAVEKLILYAGERRLIEEKDVEELIGKTKEGTIFDLTNALSEKKLHPALAALKDLFDQGMHHLMILSMIAREVRLLLHAGMLIRGGMLNSFDPKIDYARFQKNVYPVIRSWAADADVKEKGGELIRQNPYVIYNALKNSHRFSIDVLAEYLGELVDMDTVVKSTARDPRFILEGFIIKVCSS